MLEPVYHGQRKTTVLFIDLSEVFLIYIKGVFDMHTPVNKLLPTLLVPTTMNLLFSIGT